MFAVSSAKPVRRDELQSPASSPRSTPDPELESLLRSRTHTEFTFTNIVQNSVDHQDAAASDDDEETELRLFATPANAAATTQKIRLSSPGAENAEPGFAVRKPRAYYFADQPTADEQRALQAAAIDGSTVLELSRLPWPGCTLPWKVSRITAAGLKKEVLVGHPPSLVTVEDAVHKRTRKNKKTRIAIRKKRTAMKEKREEQARLAKEKEEAEREKRTRKNREKKVRKKAKQQAKMQEGAAEGTTGPAEAAKENAVED